MTIHRLSHTLRIGLFASAICLLFALSIQAGPPSDIPQPENVLTHLRAFDNLSPGEGWILLRNEIYWTEDDGAGWERITPPAAQFILAVYFSDAKHGWVVMSEPGADGIPIYAIAITQDGGVTWDRFDLDLFDQGDVSAVSNEIHLDFLDESSGWLLIKRTTGSNFDQGSLFGTVDGGITWQRLAAPGGGPVYFSSEKAGWLVAGPQKDVIYRTEDGGVSWIRQHDLTPDPGSGWHYHYYLPEVERSGTGVLPVLHASAGGTALDFYHSNDGGGTWRLANSLHVSDVPTEHIPIKPFDTKRWILALPDGKIMRTNDHALHFTSIGEQPDNRFLEDLQMADLTHGWAAAVTNACVDKVCTRYRHLLRTDSGGRDWYQVSLPGNSAINVYPDSLPEELSTEMTNGASLKESYAISGQTSIMQGQGFDKCEIATKNQLLTWYQESPYEAVNLYIGGSCRSCANTALSASYVADLASQGWSFIPTWVGPQSACWGGSCGSISNDPATAYNQGVSEADAAISVAVDLGLAAPDGSGTVLYYDLEGYSGNTAPCREGAKSFVSGWTARIQALGSVAGIYGSACRSYVPDFATIINVPDVVWLAHWIYSSYTSTATVWDVACISNDLWADQQRLRQYSGGHNEAWGGVTLNIDSNVIDGVVAVCPTAEFAAGPAISTDGSSVTLSWTAAIGATSYNIYRDTTPFFVPTTRYDFTDGTDWDDPAAAGDPAINYYYIVKPVNACGESSTIYRLGTFDFGLTPGG